MQTPITTIEDAGGAVASAAGGTPTLSPELQKAIAKVTEINSLPEITSRIVEVVEDPKATAHDLHEIVKNDPALAAKVLKVVNSAFYGLPSQVASLDRAIVLLGLSAVKNIALAASLSRFFKPDRGNGRFAAKDLWTHSVAVAVCSKMLASAVSQAHAEEAFVAGLVHDMGLLIEWQCFPEKLESVIERCLKGCPDFCAVEREVIGADHEAFGAALSARWKFPPGLRYSISYHHRPMVLRPEFRKGVGVVYLADTICCQNEFGFHLTAAHQGVDDELLATVGLTEERINEVLDGLPDQIKEAERIFNE